MYDLSGRVALVTGGGTGIGLMCAQGLAACGAKVYITGRRFDVLEKASAAWDKQIGGDILPYVDQLIHDSLLLTPTILDYIWMSQTRRAS
jgi:NAD(P)-dependent dehydrogenase (short-subunit alcohol dehydrogenase family)